MHSTAPSTVVAASVAASLVVLVAVLLVSRAAPVALVFALMASYAPYAWLGARVRRRQDERAEVWPVTVTDVPEFRTTCEDWDEAAEVDYEQVLSSDNTNRIT